MSAPNLALIPGGLADSVPYEIRGKVRDPAVHGAGQHYFTKIAGTWTCPCGATADASGKVTR